MPRDNLVGGLNQGFSILLDELDKERPAVASGMVGIARAALQAAYSPVNLQGLMRNLEGSLGGE